MESAKILVVDDEPDLRHLILQKFRNKIKAKEYEFLFAENGEQALEEISNDNTINLVLTDINMPVMDGLTLLSKLNDLNNNLLRSVIVSAYGDMENIRIAMNMGAYDFITKPINLSDLEITIEKSLREIELYKKAIKDRNELMAIQQELAIAKAIQASILPQNSPGISNRTDFEIYAKMIPAKEVGGDLYDFFMIDDNKLGIIIGDVSGKGIAAALLMAVCKTLLKATAQKGITANAILKEVNNIITEESPSNMFVTVFYGILDTKTGIFEYSNGGHNLPFLISKNSNVMQLENIGGVVLGVFKGAEYESKIIQMNPGECLFFYTDGVTEAFNDNEQEFEERRLIEYLIKNDQINSCELVDNMIRNVKNFTNGRDQSDDITCMVLKYLKG